jgi:hypothetical protein
MQALHDIDVGRANVDQGTGLVLAVLEPALLVGAKREIEGRGDRGTEGVTCAEREQQHAPSLALA